MAMPTTRTIFETGASNIKRSRSVVSLSHSNTLTMVAGKLYPILAYSDVLPGDSHSLKMGVVLRSLTPVAPLMWDAYLQCEFYWVPNKIVLHRDSMTPAINNQHHDWAAFVGAQSSLLNVGIPQDFDLPIVPVNYGAAGDKGHKSVGAYLDYPILPNMQNYDTSDTTYYVPSKLNPFALLSFYKVWSDFYREPNLWNPVTFSVVTSGTVNYINLTPNSFAGIPNLAIGVSVANALDFPDVCREHGYFGSALPWPQRNATGVMLGLGQNAPVIPIGDADNVSFGDPLIFKRNQGFVAGGNNSVIIQSTTGMAGPTTGYVGTTSSTSTGSLSTGDQIIGSNLYADLSAVPGLSINSFRYSLALQGYYEALGRYGNRYNDILRIYGVEISKLPDDCVEYLGGKRIPITATQVTALNGGDLGNVGGMINIGDYAHYFTKSMSDFGTLIGVAFIRFPETNYNFLSKERSRINKLEYWNPYFANIGEVLVRKRENWIPCDENAPGFTGNIEKIIQAQFGKEIVGFSNNDSFGFQEYGAEYRYHENTIHGEFHPVFGSLPGWTLLTNWDSLYGRSASPTSDPIQYFGLGAYLNAETQVTAWDKVFSSSASTAGYQFQLQCYFDWTAIRQVRQHSIPALLGHA